MSTPRTKVPRRPVHGVLLLDKPIGLSSNQALQKVKRLFRAEKAGHTGTLDPLATGVLPICFGAATKFSQLHLDADKSYHAVACLGVQTSTGDAEGEVIFSSELQVTNEHVQTVLKQFEGPILQTPPMHSALKKDGKALYEYAREGIEIERPARAVTIFSLSGHLMSEDEKALVKDSATQQALAAGASAHEADKKALIAAQSHLAGRQAVSFDALCSKGTYIRTLGEDIGVALGPKAHLSLLKRTKTGAFDLSQCISLAQLEAMSEQERLACVQDTDILLKGFTPVYLDEQEAARFLSGMRRRGDWPDAEQVVVYGLKPKTLLGTAHIKAGELICDRLLNPQEISEILQIRSILLESTPLAAD